MRTGGARGRFLGEERGFTLTEMLITIIVWIVTLFALYSIFDMSVKVFMSGNNKAEAMQNARQGLEKMEREIRQAHPIATPPPVHLFDVWSSSEIRFGNDLDGNGVFTCPITDPEPQCEKIGYQVYEIPPVPPADSGTFALGRDNSSTGAANSVANLRPVAEHVQSLTFTYYDATGNEVVPDVGDEACIDRVLVRLGISVDQGLAEPGTQTLTTVIDLRNRQGVPDECVE